jgi:hypothetical protein
MERKEETRKATHLMESIGMGIVMQSKAQGFINPYATFSKTHVHPRLPLARELSSSQSADRAIDHHAREESQPFTVRLLPFSLVANVGPNPDRDHGERT